MRSVLGATPYLGWWPTLSAGAGAVQGGDHMASILWLLFVVLLVLWLLGFAVNWGAFIWLLLVAALVVFVLNLMTGYRSGRWW